MRPAAERSPGIAPVVDDDGTVIVVRARAAHSTPLDELTHEEAVTTIRLLGRELAACRAAQRKTLQSWSRAAAKKRPA